MYEVIVQSDSARLVVRASRPDGDPIVMLHGGPVVPDSMQTTVAPLLPAHRCISIDQRGVGESQCLNGRYDLAAYLVDIEAVREHFGLNRWHVFGHSWGGLLAQAYTARFPDRVASLALSSSSLGLGHDWKRTKKEAFRTDRQRAGLWGTVRFLTFGVGLFVPGRIRHSAMRRVMTETWHNYFLDPKHAPDPAAHWLAGCSAEAMLKTDRAITHEDAHALDTLLRYDGRSLVLYGEYDIFGPASTVVRNRLPAAQQVTLPDSGHLHWIQNPAAYRDVLHQFFGE